jgi:hypothetical protein
MRYQQRKSQAYVQKRKARMWFPKDVKSAKAKKLYEAVRLRPVGEWSRDLVENTETGRILAQQHWINVKKVLVKAKPKSEAQVKKTLEKAVQTPQQKLVILYEKSLREPLTAEEFVRYLELFKECFPKTFKVMYGGKSPKQIAADALKGTVERRKQRGKRT